MSAGPVIRFAIELGTLAPSDPDEPDWTPYEYVVKAYHRSELTASGESVVDRQLERLDLVLAGDADAAGDAEVSLGTITLPDTVEDLDRLIVLLVHARDYLAQERPA